MLSYRLKKIASLIDKDKNVIDVGCDHGLLDIYLTLNNNNNCIASDINKNALSSAINNIKKYSLEDKIKTVISNGIDDIEIPENCTIVIAGMGTNTILNIIKKYDLNELVISSNNDYYLLRKELLKKYYIIDELGFTDKKKDYVVIKLKLGTKKYNKKDYYLGPILKTKKDEDTNIYFNNLYLKNIEILNNIPKRYIFKRLDLKIKNKWIKNR